jgi:hypothetical protein
MLQPKIFGVQGRAWKRVRGRGLPNKETTGLQNSEGTYGGVSRHFAILVVEKCSSFSFCPVRQGKSAAEVRAGGLAAGSCPSWSG